jgi:mRNA-degrading endonuclease RelE of RelBE toxin-antitoxin system
LPKDQAARIAQALARLKDDPRPRGSHKLRGRVAPLWRLRVGDFRALYSVSDRARLVVVVTVARRREDTYDL